MTDYSPTNREKSQERRRKAMRVHSAALRQMASRDTVMAMATKIVARKGVK